MRKSFTAALAAIAVILVGGIAFANPPAAAPAPKAVQKKVVVQAAQAPCYDVVDPIPVVQAQAVQQRVIVQNVPVVRQQQVIVQAVPTYYVQSAAVANVKTVAVQSHGGGGNSVSVNAVNNGSNGGLFSRLSGNGKTRVRVVSR